ncbi:MAG: hypothetical protein M3167_20080, partial [Acidobacteriota bacterium]|nr:hypothetical protein [Acidobacteriota bacterium]
MRVRASGGASFAGSAILMAALASAFGCSSSKPPAPSPRPEPSAPPATPTAVNTPNPNPLVGLEAEATLVELEDRRAFDETALRALCAGPEPTRARAALALGRIG